MPNKRFRVTLELDADGFNDTGAFTDFFVIVEGVSRTVVRLGTATIVSLDEVSQDDQSTPA